jgi:hypothetical protein
VCRADVVHASADALLASALAHAGNRCLIGTAVMHQHLIVSDLSERQCVPVIAMLNIGSPLLPWLACFSSAPAGAAGGAHHRQQGRHCALHRAPHGQRGLQEGECSSCYMCRGRFVTGSVCDSTPSLSCRGWCFDSMCDSVPLVSPISACRTLHRAPHGQRGLQEGERNNP